ncbi:MAG: GyrI-like domain-containing protein [Aminipila sp.]
MSAETVIGKAIIFIENHLYESLSASMVADAVSYSYYHFHRYFLSVMGETIGSYIRGRRLTLAAYELVHSDRKVLDIAISLYFETAESFARAFKNKYRLTPTEYRKNGIDVLLANHPIINTQVYSYKNYGILNPQIVSIPPTTIIGYRFSMSIQNNPSVTMWDNLNQYLSVQSKEIQNKCRYGVYEMNDSCMQTNFCENSQATAFIGVEIKGHKAVPNLEIKELSGGQYIKFIHKGTVETLFATYQYIWGIWYPQSGYEIADREDFECYTEKFLGPYNENSEIEIYFPIL